ncbi:LysR family transcriptional regulator [Proteus mirabilis]|uniref:LysR family transcriptional regulator n=1 Tax=Proteus vulgaris TaxID=585 RepID=A0A6G6SIS3_PROVU|nr:LysR family transcriptional regulator [Proteus vulgaris]MBG3080553.1 LysR family transcriptional regulator [Proteus mirabilis]QIF94317.1 LysR family transcriptional regulator [Proteus vulgaris]WIF70448.1 LysR family transcriptional regulator [Proteus vulgaris]CRL59932.1 Glycine cleavage system transcriptional activator [Proteus vulgaris]SUC01210.1 DNA-binding transcriptional activator GcvA [Proteus vulgaris]
MKMPSLTSLRFFNSAAQTGSFVSAAEQLHVTHSAVSRQIRLLEDELGIALFERRNRAVYLNEAGQYLYKTTSAIFEQLEETVTHLRTPLNNPVLVVSCEPTIAMKWLIPRLSHFYALHPEITLHLVAAGGAIDFNKEGVDLAFRRDDFFWSKNIYATKICDEKIGAVIKPNNLHHSNKQLITLSRPQAWQDWFQYSGVVSNYTKTSEYEHFYLAIQATLAGLGATIASFLMVQDELHNQQLVAINGFVKDNSSYYLLSPIEITPDSKQEKFKNWIIAEAEKSSKKVDEQSL